MSSRACPVWWLKIGVPDFAHCRQLSITLDDVVADRVQTVARTQHTTVEGLFVTFVSSLTDAAENDAHDTHEDAASQLVRTFQTLSRPLGGKGYTTRDELHER